MTTAPPPSTSRPSAILAWFDAWAAAERMGDVDDRRVDWMRVVPFLALHLACLAAFAVGVGAFALVWATALYLVRMFAITAFYHRYFSHRSFKLGRGWQFVFAVLGNASAQRGPLWWAAHHRHHHRWSDTEEDTHSPTKDGFWWSHVGWILTRKNFKTQVARVPDLAKFPELVFLDRFDALVPVVMFAGSYGLGAWLETAHPALRTNGPQLLVWTIISTVVLFHATFTINSLAHVWGTRRYPTEDTSRNNLWLALLTLGEGWHNNHHRHQASTRQGFAWWEIDVSWYVLYALSKVGVVRDLTPVPAAILEEGGLRRGPDAP